MHAESVKSLLVRSGGLSSPKERGAAGVQLAAEQSCIMATHEELVAELPRLDKLSNAARLKHAKKRRLKQLKRYQEYVRQQRALSATASTGGNMKKRAPTRVSFENGSILGDMVSRNELLEGE